MAKDTLISIFDDGTAEVVTSNRKWINRMNKLVEEGHAEEIETDMTGQAFQFDASLFRLPFYRAPREWTDEEREAARERMAKVREKSPTVQKGKAKSGKPTTKPGLSKKAASAPKENSADIAREEARTKRALVRTKK